LNFGPNVIVKEMNVKESYYEVLAKYNKPIAYTSHLSKLLGFVLGSIQGFHYDKYWKRREYVINPQKGNKLLKLYYLFWVKKVDARNHCAFGTSYNRGALFKTPPVLEHGPNGIIVGDDARIGSKCYLYQQVTIAWGG